MATLLDKYYNVRIKLRNDSHSNWKIQENKDFRPYDGEIIIYDILGEKEAVELNISPINFQMVKIGDGVHTIKELPFINDIRPWIKTGEKLGTIQVLDQSVYVKGLTEEEQNIYMAFQLIENYYVKTEIDKKVEEIYTKIDDNFSILSKQIEELSNKVDNNFLILSEKNNELSNRIDNNFLTLSEKINKVQNDSIVEIKKLENGLDYDILQGKQLINTIVVPPQIYVSSGEIINGNQIKLNFVNKKESVFIDLSKLTGIDGSGNGGIYYPFENATNVQIEIDQENRIIAANLLDGTVNLGKLQAELRELIINGVGAGGTFDMGLLSEIALTGNVNDLIQYDGDYLILNCN